MEMELMEPGVKSLGYKIKGMSRESPSQKAVHILDTDLRTHWSTGTNTKEWILLELDQPCLLSQLRIYNKSVLEWEIALGLRYKPEAFVKVRPRCEAPRRDMMYPMNYTPCRYVRISCLRGNPIAIFFIQLIGVPVPGLEPEFQPVVNHLLPHILAHKQDAQNMHLQLLQDMAKRLVAFLPQLEADLTCFSEAPESITRFLALIAGPLYPILHIVSEREAVRASASVPDSDASKNTQAITLTVSSNFEILGRKGVVPVICYSALLPCCFSIDPGRDLKSSGLIKMSFSSSILGRNQFEKETTMFHILKASVLSQEIKEEEDSWLWKCSNTNCFTVKSFYTYFAQLGSSNLAHTHHVCVNMVWKVKIASEVKFFMWGMMLGSVQTKENLIFRGMVLDPMCVMCKNVEETMGHPVLHCSFTKGIWDKVLRPIGRDGLSMRNFLTIESMLEHGQGYKDRS
ncbi:Tubulin binding cofactor a [Thalictrum thalictroides]|uniref:Tubulin binding cofactor a n=1 Tax=Thalictrum thalictroides TaxID=46969 RepID=A0A7J6VUX2_THATH|nr:Tubulin binding cofactor a [Thalictrum thalictroides]